MFLGLLWRLFNIAHIRGKFGADGLRAKQARKGRQTLAIISKSDPFTPRGAGCLNRKICEAGGRIGLTVADMSQTSFRRRLSSDREAAKSRGGPWRRAQQVQTDDGASKVWLQPEARRSVRLADYTEPGFDW